MGVYVNVFFDHNLSRKEILNFRDRLNQFSMLSQALQEATSDESNNSLVWDDSWRGFLEDGRDFDELLSEAEVLLTTSSQLLYILPHACMLSANVRWRAFASDASCRNDYRIIAYELACILHSPAMLWTPEYFDGIDIAGDGGTLSDISGTLNKDWGPSKPSSSELLPTDFVQTNLWFFDQLTGVTREQFYKRTF